MNNVLSTLLALSAAGGVLAVLVWCCLRLLRGRVSQRFGYYLWLLVLLRLVAPVGLPVSMVNGMQAALAPAQTLPASQQAAAPDADAPAGYQAETPDGGQTDRLAGQAADGYTAPADSAPAGDAEPVQGNDAPALALPDTSAADDETAAQGAEPALTEPAGHWWQALQGAGFWLAVWAVGAAVSLGWFALAYGAYLLRLRRCATLPDAEDAALFARMYGQCHVRLAASRAAYTPQMVGVFRPTLYLPASAYCTAGREQQLALIFRHEMTHYRRRDLWYKWLTVLVTSLHWFNPAMLLVRRQINRRCELACDEAVIRGMDDACRTAYGDMLLAMSGRRAVPAGAVSTTLSEGGQALRERLLHIKYAKPLPRRAIALMTALALLLGGCGAALGPVQDSAAPQEEPSGSGAVQADETGGVPLAGLAAEQLQEYIDGERAWQNAEMDEAFAAHFAQVAPTLKVPDARRGETAQTFSPYNEALETMPADSRLVALALFPQANVYVYGYYGYTDEDGNTQYAGIVLDTGDTQTLHYYPYGYGSTFSDASIKASSGAGAVLSADGSLLYMAVDKALLVLSLDQADVPALLVTKEEAGDWLNEQLTLRWQESASTVNIAANGVTLLDAAVRLDGTPTGYTCSSPEEGNTWFLLDEDGVQLCCRPFLLEEVEGNIYFARTVTDDALLVSLEITKAENGAVSGWQGGTITRAYTPIAADTALLPLCTYTGIAQLDYSDVAEQTFPAQAQVYNARAQALAGETRAAGEELLTLRQALYSIQYTRSTRIASDCSSYLTQESFVSATPAMMAIFNDGEPDTEWITGVQDTSAFSVDGETLEDPLATDAALQPVWIITMADLDGDSVYSAATPNADNTCTFLVNARTGDCWVNHMCDGYSPSPYLTRSTFGRISAQRKGYLAADPLVPLALTNEEGAPFAAMGGQAVLYANDLTELEQSAGDGQTAPATMPVYKNAAVSAAGLAGAVAQPDEAAMQQVLAEKADLLGLTVDELTVERQQWGEEGTLGALTATAADGTSITVNADLSAEAQLAQPLTMLAGRDASYGSDRERLLKGGAYVIAHYSEYLGLQQPVAYLTGGDTNIYGESTWSLCFREGAGASLADRLLAECVHTVSLGTNENGDILSLHWGSPMPTEKVGDYPVIDEAAARQRLQEGGFFTTVSPDSWPAAEQRADAVSRVTLVYLATPSTPYVMPYYRMLLRLETDEDAPAEERYGVFVVPALESGYLSDLPGNTENADAGAVALAPAGAIWEEQEEDDAFAAAWPEISAALAVPDVRLGQRAAVQDTMSSQPNAEYPQLLQLGALPQQQIWLYAYTGGSRGLVLDTGETQHLSYWDHPYDGMYASTQLTLSKDGSLLYVTFVSGHGTGYGTGDMLVFQLQNGQAVAGLHLQANQLGQQLEKQTSVKYVADTDTVLVTAQDGSAFSAEESVRMTTQELPESFTCTYLVGVNSVDDAITVSACPLPYYADGPSYYAGTMEIAAGIELEYDRGGLLSGWHLTETTVLDAAQTQET